MATVEVRTIPAPPVEYVLTLNEEEAKIVRAALGATTNEWSKVIAGSPSAAFNLFSSIEGKLPKPNLNVYGWGIKRLV